ncbi:MAG: asparagine synthase (glutamine-hydrolyzing) [Chloroflexi bacterium]|nr:asparagine synthase (glutamine-hydrolyzing) [Chloroflexota bacterium]
MERYLPGRLNTERHTDMCGICGFYGYRDDRLLNEMNGLLIHRGPDEDGFFYSDQCSLAMRRLSIVDVKTGRQPSYSTDESVVSVFNGEIYNFIELREQLEKKGYKFRSDHSDSEVIPNLYMEYGTKFVELITGMFAIAIYDKKAKKLLLVRDRVGKKPLYYARRDGGIFFSSEIKSLKRAGFGKSLREESVYCYFAKRNTCAPYTIYSDILQMEPASVLEFDGNDCRTFKYWDIQFTGDLKLKDEREYIELLTEEFEKSVAKRMNMDVEYGSYLSGGLDSSLVTAVLASMRPRKLKTFTLTYRDTLEGKEEDKKFADRMSGALGTEHYEYLLTGEEVFRDLPDILRSFDEPFAGVVSTFFLSKLITRHVKVAFSGDGADEIFGSYLTHRLSSPIEYLRRFVEPPAYSRLSQADKTRLAPFNTPAEYEKLLGIYEKNNTKWRDKFLVFNEAGLGELFNREVGFIPGFNIETKGKSELNITLESEFKDQLHNQVLAFVDRLSMAHSIEIRSPFLDYELVELVASFPAHLKIKDGENKYVLKKTALKYLPQDLVFRKKEGFVLPNYRWIEGDYYGLVRDTILGSKMIEGLGMNRGYISCMLDKLKSDGLYHARVWCLYNFAVWYDL